MQQFLEYYDIYLDFFLWIIFFVLDDKCLFI